MMTDKFKERVKEIGKRVDKERVTVAELIYTKKQLCNISIESLNDIESLVDSLPFLIETTQKREDLLTPMGVISTSHVVISLVENIFEKIRNCDDVESKKKDEICKKIRTINEKTRACSLEYLRKYGKNEREELLK